MPNHKKKFPVLKTNKKCLNQFGRGIFCFNIKAIPYKTIKLAE